MTVKDNEIRIEALEKLEEQRQCGHKLVTVTLTQEGCVRLVRCLECDAILYTWAEEGRPDVPFHFKRERCGKKIYNTYVKE